MSSSDEIKAQLDKAQAELDEAASFFAKMDEPVAELTNEMRILRETYEKQYAELTEKKNKALADAYEANQKKAQANQNLIFLQSQLEAALKKEEAEKKAEADRLALEEANKILTDKWDQLTLTAPWREWAKDHQIDAGHKITQDRYVILADPMGLGKTLSAIITTEMAERATKDADPDHPFLGEEKEVFVNGYWKAEDGTDLGKFVSNETKELHNAEFVKGHYENQIVNSITRPVGRKILYLCPASLLRNVLKEFRRWAPHRNATFAGGMTKAERGYLFEFVLNGQSNYVLICNYEAWRRDTKLIDEFIERRFDTVILDEAHNLKNMKSSAYKGVFKLLQESKPEYVIPMTGTPILNRPQELFSLLTLVNFDEFYDLNSFLYTYCEQDDEGFWKFQDGGLERIGKRIRKNFLRRTRDQAGIELPPVTIINHDLEVDTDSYPEQARVREEMRKFATIMVDQAKGKGISAPIKLALFTRLRQIETWPAGIKIEKKEKKDGKVVIVDTIQVDVRESQKVDYLIHLNHEDKMWDGLIPEAISDERMVVFSQFKAPLYEIADRIRTAGFRPIIYDGDTPRDLKDQIEDDFDAKTTSKEDAKWDIVLCNYKAGGVGLNFTGASQVIVLDEEWNPGKRDQAYGRVDRIGQTHSVTVHVVRTQKTMPDKTLGGIDQWLANIMNKKEEVTSGFESHMSMPTDEEFLEALESGLI